MTSGASATNSAAYLRMSVGVTSAPTIIDPNVAAVDPAKFLQALQKRRRTRPPVRIVRGGTGSQDANAPHPVGCCARAASGHAAAARRRAG